MRVKLFLLFILLLICISAEGQVTFKKSYNANFAGGGKTIVRTTTDAGYAFFSSDGPLEDFFLIKTNLFGDTLWTKCYGDSAEDNIADAIQTNDSGFILVGTKKYGLNPIETYLVKTNSFGDTLWTRSYSYNSYSIVPRTVCELKSNGGFVVAGLIDSVCAGCFDAFIMCLDSQGDTVWTRSFGGYQGDLISSILQTPDQGFLAVGYTEILGPALRNTLILKLDPNGFIQWSKAFAFSNFVDAARKVTYTRDGGYLLTGITSISTQDAYVMKLDSAIDTVWTRIFSVPGYIESFGIDETPDSGFIFIGYDNNLRMCLIRGDHNGDTIWTKAFPGWGAGYSVCSTSDSGIISSGIGDSQLIKLNDAGNFSCQTDSSTTFINRASATIMNINFPSLSYNSLNNVHHQTAVGSGTTVSLYCIDCNFPVLIQASGIYRCDGDTVTLLSDPPGESTYWSTGDTTEYLMVTTSGSYSVQVSDTNGCMGSDTIFIYFNTLPMTIISGFPDTVCNNELYVQLNGEPDGGTFSGLGVTDSVFIPSQANPGWNVISYQFTDTNGCSNTAYDSVFIEICLEIAGATNFIRFGISPNPVNSFIKITNAAGSVVTLLNPIGEIALSGVIRSNEEIINCENLPSGIYFVQLQNKSGTTVQKLIKQ